MAKIYTSEFLKNIGLTNTTERVLPNRSIVEVSCVTCGIKNNIVLKTLLYKFSKTNKVYSCRSCSALAVDYVAKNKKIKQNCLNKHGVEHPSQLNETKEKRYKFNLNKYGVKHSFQSEEIKAKSKQTMLDRHGVENPSQSCQIQEKKVLTSINRYGTENPQQSELIKNKTKKTNLERYGFESTLQVPEFKQKTKQTMIDTYGVENAFQSKEIKEKIKQTNLELYGETHFLKTKDGMNKLKNSNLEKHGVECYFQSQEFLDMADVNQWFTSTGEIEVKEYIKSLGFFTCKKRPERCELDIVIKKNNLAIEYNGLYWHSEAIRPNNYHLNKTKIAKKHGYRLIHIFEHEWNNRQEQVKSYLKSALGLNTAKIFARKCQIIETDVSDFVDKYHIQGKGRSILGLALVYEGQIVAAATFGKHHRDVKKIVLNRFVSFPNTTIVGGLSRLSKYASNYFKQDIISWCDLRWSEGNGYLKAGWEFEAKLAPDYFYIKSGRVYSKQSRKKSNVNTPEGMTEHEHALQDGLLRVYDCGKIRFIYKYKKRGPKSSQL